jgi:hypothetical protein
MSDLVPNGVGDLCRCRCGTVLPEQAAAWGCTDCAGDCCPACAVWLESTVYCPDCTDRLLAA